MTCLALAALLLAQPQDTEEDKAARAAVRALAEALKDGTRNDADGRRTAVLKAGETKHWIVARALGDVLLSGTEGDRTAAARALGGLAGVGNATDVLVAGLRADSNKKRSDVRIEILQSLAKLAGKDALPAVHPLVKDDDAFVARQAIITLPKYKNPPSIKVLIDWLMTVERPPDNSSKLDLDFNLGMVELPDFDQFEYPLWNFELRLSVDDQQRIRHAVLLDPLLKTLTSATGQKFKTYKEWSGWWRREGGSFKFP